MFTLALVSWRRRPAPARNVIALPNPRAEKTCNGIGRSGARGSMSAPHGAAGVHLER